MKIYWEQEKTKKRLEDRISLIRQYDLKVAKQVAQRLLEISKAPSYAQLPPAAHPHPIKEGTEVAYFVVDVSEIGKKRGRLRLSFRPKGTCDPAHLETITEVIIIGLIDYHKG